MNNNLTDLTLIVDRSGSMFRMRDEANESITNFINKQKELAGDCHLTIAHFNETYYIAYDGDIHGFEKYNIDPKGLTALYDSIGKTINKIGDRLSKLNENDRPGLVVVVILTDGEENSSVEYNHNNIHEMIEHQKNKYNWQFVFLGKGIDVANQGKSLSVDNYASYSNYGGAVNSVNANVTRMRNATMENRTVVNSFLDTELNEMNK